MRDELVATLASAETDDQVRSLVITGNGRAFSAGQDLKELATSLDDADYVGRDGDAHLAELQDLTRQLITLKKPTVAALNGVAVGLGAELALACDLRIASEAASIGFVEVKRGLFETNGVMYILPRLVGYGRAMELLLTGDPIAGRDAERIGLVNRVVTADALLEEALGLASAIAQNAPISVRLVKSVLRETYDHSLDGVMDLEVEGMKACLATSDLREGTQAFIEKRAPVYLGR